MAEPLTYYNIAFSVGPVTPPPPLLSTQLTAASVSDRLATSDGFTWQVTSNRAGAITYVAIGPIAINEYGFVTMTGGTGAGQLQARQAATATHQAGYAAVNFQVTAAVDTNVNRGYDYVDPGYASVTSWQPAITITQGGTYPLNYRSLDSNTPAVRIQTTEPVILTGNIASAGDLVQSFTSGNHVTCRGGRYYGLTQSVAGKRRGKTVDLGSTRHFEMINCYVERTSGIYIAGIEQDGSILNSVHIAYNYIKDVDGKFLAAGQDGRIRETAQFVQFNNCHYMKGTSIHHNIVINTPGVCDTEDIINLYNSFGTSNADPIRIYRNLIRGAYPNPATSSVADGGGILISDGSRAAPELHNRFIVCEDNQVLETSNYGIQSVGGTYQTIQNNRILSTARDPQTNAIIPSMNIGLTLDNHLFDTTGTTYFHDISISGNLVSFSSFKYDGGSISRHNNFDVRDREKAAPNIYYPETGPDANGRLFPADHIITHQDVENEALRFRDYLKTLPVDIRIGPVPA